MLERAGITTDPAMRSMMESMHPIKRMGRPEEVGDVAVWLCTDAASFVNGIGMLVDGGYVAQ
jgi:NAD(P)-dependent dehydrogenase (short-subunit alcohol dehydrogenase family)